MRLCNKKYNVEKSTLDDETLIIKRPLNNIYIYIYVALGNYIVKDIIGKISFYRPKEFEKLYEITK